MRRFTVVFTLVCTSVASAGSVTVPHTFQDSTPAVAGQVNANFDALVQAVNDMQAQINTQQATISQLQSDLDSANETIADLQDNTVLTLDGYLLLDSDANENPIALFNSVNVQIVNGLGATNGNPMLDEHLPGPVNGLGNLVIGYNEDSQFALDVCSH